MTLLANPSEQAAPLDQRDPRVRLGRLLDVDSATELPGDPEPGVFTVRGRVQGAPVVAFCTDGTVMGGSLSMPAAERIVEAIDAAVRDRCPVIGLWHSGGARLADGVSSMNGVGRMFAAMTRASGQVPQISVVLGPAAGAAAYGPALTDVVIMAPAGRIFINGPDVVRRVTGEDIDMVGLGGADAHARKSGVVHVMADSEADAYVRAHKLVSSFTKPGLFNVPAAADSRDPVSFLPESRDRVYDVRPLLCSILDEDDSWQELQARWAANVVVGFGRLAGRAIGVVANNPLCDDGWLDSLSAEKAARFVRMCDAFGIPLLVVVDAPGYLPGVAQEWSGVVRRGAKLLHAFAAAVVPRVTLITRNSHGGAYIAMNSRSLGATRVFAWPDAEVAVMGAEPAVDVLYRKQLATAAPEDLPAVRAELIAKQNLEAGGVGKAMAIGVVDEIIPPEETRSRLAAALAAAPAGRGHHSNIPL
jgi:acetyl-CoA/propionyl-CoA carboxylase carboxyl transferase subunit